MSEFIEKLDESGAEALTAVSEFLKQSSSFVAEQVPIYVQELLTFAFFDHCLSVVLFLILTTILAFISYKVYKLIMTEKDAENRVFCFGIMGIILGMGLIVICTETQPVHNLKQAVKIKVAPRVYVIDHIRGEIDKANKDK